MQGNPHDTHLTKTFQYFCELRVKKEPPLTVAISNVSNCDPAFLSGKIPVRNRERPNKNTTLKKFGVCLGGVVVQKGNDDKMLKDLVEFIEMNRLLGAEIFTFYINEMQISAEILRHILDRYANIVQVIEWKKFEPWSPLHYYGQMLTLTDCFYRNMYEVDILAFMDLDEILLPVQSTNWSKMLAKIYDNRVPVYSFQNSFFVNDSSNLSKKLPPHCTNLSTYPKYFTKTNRVRCVSPYRTKCMVRPTLITQSGVHGLDSVKGCKKPIRIPTSIGINAHYRNEIPEDCHDKRLYRDLVAMKFEDKFIKQTCN